MLVIDSDLLVRWIQALRSTTEEALQCSRRPIFLLPFFVGECVIAKQASATEWIQVKCM